MNMSGIIKGKKTITSCIVAAIVAVLQYLGIIDISTAEVLYQLATAFGLYGLRDAVKTEAK